MLRRKRKLFKKLHKWPALVISLFIILWAISGIILNHRHTFSSIDINRNLLPLEHHYNNWNNAALRGSVKLDSNRSLIYGNIGVYEYRPDAGSFMNMNAGFPCGADHIKINSLLKTTFGQLFAGTRFGLFKFDEKGKFWFEIPVPHADKHIVDLMQRNDSLWVMSRSELWTFLLGNESEFNQLKIPPPEGYDNRVGLFKTLWVIHSGEIYGLAGKLLVDFVALVFIFLTLSGLIYFFFPGIIKKRNKRSKRAGKLIYWNKWSFKWHNKIGIWLALVLIVTTLTGMFLRPPLLIAIAQSRVNKIPFSMLDDGNPWFDQLRKIVYDPESNVFYLATSEGIYTAERSLTLPLKKCMPQPPASVMGYNVFEFHGDDHILVGSFSGLYLWSPASGAIYDYISGLPHRITPGPAMPLSDNMISGFYRDHRNNEYYFDYNRGAVPLRHPLAFPAMPDLIGQTRIPLWNVALELHTARLFKPLMGDFYILFIPLFGLSTLLVLISGVVLWLRIYRRRKKK